MSLKYKAIIIVLASVAAMLATTAWVTRSLVRAQFQQLESHRARADVRDAERLIQSMLAEFAQRAQDWSDWDDLATHLHDGNSEFFKTNVSVSSLEPVGFDFLVVVRDDGVRRTSVMVDKVHKSLVDVPRELDALIDSGRLKAERKTTSGLLVTGSVVRLLVSRPVLRSDHTEPETRGWMIVGQTIDSTWVDRFQRYTSLKVEFFTATSPTRDRELEIAREALDGRASEYLTRRVSGVSAAYTRVNDIAGRPALELRLTRASELTAAADKTLASLVRVNAFSGVMVALLAALLIHWGVSRPLRRLAHGVEQLRLGNWSTVEIRGRDETAALADAFNQMALTIAERERTLRSILDNIGDGLVKTTPLGHIVGTVSAPGVRWFGAATASTTLWDWIQSDGQEREWFRCGYEQIRDGLLPFAVLAAQMPRRIRRGDRTYELDYRPVFEVSERLDSVLVVIRDITVQLEQERSEEQSQEMQLAIGNWLRNRAGFRSTLEECERLVRQVCSEEDARVRYRSLHTLKAVAAAAGLLRLSKFCHSVEERLASEPNGFSEHESDELRSLWQRSVDNLRGLLDSDEQAIDVSKREFDELRQALAEHRPHQVLQGVVESWTCEPLSKSLENLGATAEKLAQEQHKRVNVRVVHGNLRARGPRLSRFLASLTHVVRNAVDHGVEASDERFAAGKPIEASLLIQAAASDGRLTLSIQDDGRGIDWQRVRERARLLGLKADDEADLANALFVSGVTTREGVTEISGRGVGLEATYRALRDVGGDFSVQTAKGIGSTFEFVVPWPDERRGV